MVTKTIKFNIKQFIEDYIFCVESKDGQGEKELLKKFDKVFYSSSVAVKASMQMYLFNSRVAREYPKLHEIITRCIIF